jgi:hypothetical protein
MKKLWMGYLGPEFEFNSNLSLNSGWGLKKKTHHGGAGKG